MPETLSIIIPAYNEASTIEALLDRVLAVDLTHMIRKEIIVVNNGSTDRTGEMVVNFIQKHPAAGIRYVKLDKNLGKGGALHAGIALASGEYLIIQDADLEYDPREYNLLLRPLVENEADIVYGSRFMGGNPHRILFYWHSIGNRFLTSLSNMLTNLNLSDMETCYKLFRTPLIKSLPLREKGFGFEPEVTARIARIKGVRIFEVGISYYGRTYEDGKKINWKDGLRAIYCILKYNLFPSA